MATTVHPPRQGENWQTHEVLNQPPPLLDVDVFSSNLPLVEALQREGGGWAAERAAELGRFVGGKPQQCGAAWRTRTSRCCAHTTATETASTRSSSTLRGTTS